MREREKERERESIHHKLIMIIFFFVQDNKSVLKQRQVLGPEAGSCFKVAGSTSFKFSQDMKSRGLDLPGDDGSMFT